ncbi:MAG: zinc ribbon domain-containing protein [Spirulinaceae cyanobacterium RM2_2_10]|nr:zinc ribbon domain-containing protein [Spirulinaceae cyanobacterium SM2_1_0]NJO19329.1 zinc ribbon domain-containing protein [Spirulinaceae cyanobacterium RM2_2_10]
MSAYVGHLAAGTQVQIMQQGNQTQITLMTQNAGQQQSQSSSFATGVWKLPPTLFRTTSGAVLRLEGDRPSFIQLQAGQLQALATPPELSGAEVLPLQPIAAPAASTLEPLQPLPPLKMGNMSMQMQPMTMQMGDMQLSMGEGQTTRRFCSQCGQPVAAGDRFCSACGQQLQV